MSTGFDETDSDTGCSEPRQILFTMESTLDAIARYAQLASTCERWEFIRTGWRQPIWGIKRRLIFERDGNCCRNCGIHVTARTGQLDHIMPWSAGGSDCSCNLRVLCGPCNGARSNFRSGLDDQLVGGLHVAIECIGCAHLTDGSDEPYPVVPGLILAYCGYCGIVSPTFPEVAM